MLLTLSDFLTSLFRGVGLLGLAVAAGGVAWGLAVLRAPGRGDLPPRAIGRCLDLVALGAVILALAQAAALLLEIYVLSSTLGRDPFGELLAIPHFIAGLARAVLALALTVAAVRLRASPRALAGWLIAGALAGLLVTSGAWSTHAAGRLEHRGGLMILTVAHQLGAVIWVGGLVQLGALWRLVRPDVRLAAAWPSIVRRFSGLAAAAVAVLVVSAVPLAWTYTGSWQRLAGTGYGSLLLVKITLLLAVLALAFVNRRAVRARNVSGAGAALRGRLPRFAEAEAIMLVIVLFAAASLSAQPPAADQPAADTATVAEVAEVFRPKIPELRVPSREAMQRSRAASGGERTREAYLWSNFSHNVAGLILLGTSLFALAALARGTGWDRHWPLGLVALAAFVYLRAAANEAAWPFGPTALWHIDAEGLQHRMAAGLVLVLGLVEWRARARPRPGSVLPYLLPALAGAGGVLLLTHSHAAFQSKASFLVQVTHSTMGGIAAVLAAARWLELRLEPPAGRWAGAAASLAMVGIALVLVFYREANLVIGN